METTQVAVVHGNQAIVLNASGTIDDIIESVIYCDLLGIGEVEKLTTYIQGSTAEEICRSIYNFVTEYIPYIEDKEGEQCCQTPAQLWLNRKKKYGGTGAGGDCKSMAVFCSSLLRSLGFSNYNFRFISQEANKVPHHVYLVVYGNIILDCTIKPFNKELHYTFKQDQAPVMSNKPAIGRSKPVINATQAETQLSEWERINNEWATNFNQINLQVRIQVMQGIKFYWDLKPLKRAKALTLVNDDVNWENLSGINAQNTGKGGIATALIYRYWNEPLYQAELTGVTVPFPQELEEKRTIGNGVHDDLRNVGIREGDLLGLCGLATYAMYGISLEYMLYRCKCQVLYGQEWAPRPGVPYYNMKTGAFVSNGATLETTLQIAMCLPADGGTGRPIGEPYWCVGGYIMQNGADTATLNEFTKNVPKPGNIVNGGTGIAQNVFSICLQAYNQWRSGQLVVIPQPITLKRKSGDSAKPHMGLAEEGVEAAVSIGLMIAKALAQMIPQIIELVNLAKSKPEDWNKKIPLPPPDFKMQFKTVDGCMIGYNTSGTGCKIMKYCPGGSSVQGECNPDLSLPQNQPSGGFVGGTNNMIKYAGFGLLALGAVALVSSSNNSPNK